MQVIPNSKITTMGKFSETNIFEQLNIQTDAYYSYHKTLAQKYFHEYDVLSPDSEMLKLLNILIGNAKAFVGVTVRGLDGKHLQRYLDEFTYRFNRRKLPDIFANICSAVISYTQLCFAE